MSERPQGLSLKQILQVRDTCPCFNLKRAARIVARHYDDALRPVGLSNGQYSLLVYCSRPAASGVTDAAKFLGMDRTTLTANLKPLVARGLLIVQESETDRRRKILKITAAGHRILIQAFKLWEAATKELGKTFNSDLVSHINRQLDTNT